MGFGVAENRNLHFTYFGYISVFMWIGILSYHVAHAMTLTPFQTKWFFQNRPTSQDRNRKYTELTSTSTSNTYIWSNIVCCWFFRWLFFFFFSFVVVSFACGQRMHVVHVCISEAYLRKRKRANTNHSAKAEYGIKAIYIPRKQQLTSDKQKPVARLVLIFFSLRFSCFISTVMKLSVDNKYEIKKKTLALLGHLLSYMNKLCHSLAGSKPSKFLTRAHLYLCGIFSHFFVFAFLHRLVEFDEIDRTFDLFLIQPLPWSPIEFRHFFAKKKRRQQQQRKAVDKSRWFRKIIT